MSEPTTRRPVIAPEEVEKLVKALEARGGSVTIQDPRVSQVQTWLIGLVGTGAVIAMGWMANSIDNLNRTVERNNAQLEYMDRRIARLEDRKP